MSRRIGLWILLACFAIVAGLAGSAWWATRRIPEFYRESLQLPGTVAEQKRASEQLVRRSLKLVDDIQYSSEWAEEFTENQVNSWLVHELPTKFGHIVPREISDPRVQFRPDEIDVGFQFDSPQWSGVVSLTVAPGVTDDHRILLEIVRVRAGQLPIPVETIVHQIAENLKLEDADLEWSRSKEGRDQLLIALSGEKSTSAKLAVFEVQTDRIRLAGAQELAP